MMRCERSPGLPPLPNTPPNVGDVGLLSILLKLAWLNTFWASRRISKYFEPSEEMGNFFSSVASVKKDPGLRMFGNTNAALLRVNAGVSTNAAGFKTGLGLLLRNAPALGFTSAAE